MNKDNIHKNNKIVYYDYKVGDKVMIYNHAAYKYETPYKGPCVITQCWSNGTVTLRCDATNIWYNICHTKTYTSDIAVEDIIF